MSEALTSGHDAGAFLRALEDRARKLAAAPARALACALAERHLHDLGEEDGDTRRMIARVRATRGTVARAQLETWTREMQRTREGIDPDRLDANDERRALSVIERAIAACTEGAPPDALFAAMRAALASRVLRFPADDDRERDAELKALTERWTWDAVRDEARWLAAELGPDEGASSPAPSAPEAPRVHEAPDASAPRELSLSLAGRTLRFVGVNRDAMFRAEVDGRRSLLRTRQRFVELRTAGEIGAAEESGEEPPWRESSVVDLAALLAALDAGAVRREEGGRVLVEVHREGAHFRQNDWTTVTIELMADGTIQIETTRTTQDESYY